MASSKFASLITAIKKGDHDMVKAVLEEELQENRTQITSNNNIASVTDEDRRPVSEEDKQTLLHTALKTAPNLKIIELLLNNGADSDIEDINGEDALCLAIKNRKLKEIFTQPEQMVSRKLLGELDLNYRYSGPLNDKTKKVNKNEDNYLHIAARARNIEAFLFIFKKSVKADIPLLEYNEDHENPFHIAARSGILKVVVKEMLRHLKSTANGDIERLESHIKTAREDGNNEKVKIKQKELKEVKRKLESDENYIKDALNSKCASSKDNRTPLDWVSKAVKNEVREIAGIKDRWIDNKNLRLFLCIVAVVLFIVTLCVSLGLLFRCAESLALATVASICVTGIVSTGTVIISEICKEDGPYTNVSDSEVASYDSLSQSA